MGTTRGLTLIELLVVITIVAVLAALIIDQMRQAQEQARITRTSTRIGAVTSGLALIGQQEGSIVYRLQQLTDAQPGDLEPGLGGIMTFDQSDPAAGVAAGLPTPGHRPPPRATQINGTWGVRGRAHLAFPWGKKFPDPATSALMGPERFRLRDFSPFNTRKLLTVAGILPTKAGDPTWSATEYMTNRRTDAAWNDAWGRPLVVGSMLYQPTWRTASPAPTVPGWTDGAWAAAGNGTVPFSAYGPTMETPAAPGDRSARRALLDHLKLYQHNRSVHAAVAAVGPHAWVDDAALTSSTASDWADSPMAPVDGTLGRLWAQANWVCQQAKEQPFDQDWDELAVDNPRWPGVRSDYLNATKHQADANRAHYAGQYQGGYERCLLSAPQVYK